MHPYPMAVVGTQTRLMAENYRAKNPEKFNFTFKVVGFKPAPNSGLRSALSHTYITITAVDFQSARMMVNEMMPTVVTEFLSKKYQ